MAVQEWTIITLVGPASSDAADRFDRWWKARGSEDLACSDQWSASIRREVSAYLSTLVEHRWRMPVAYFSQHIDPWSMGYAGKWHLCDQEPEVWHDTGQLRCYRLPDHGELVKRNESAAKSSQFSESEWLATRLVEAVRAYESLWPEAVLLVNRLAVTTSPTDEELKRDAAKLPTWLDGLVND